LEVARDGFYRVEARIGWTSLAVLPAHPPETLTLRAVMR